MKMIRRFFAVALCLTAFAGGSSVAQAAVNPGFFGNIHHGNWKVGGSGSFGHTWTQGYNTTYLTFAPSAEYFFMDRLSAGGTANLFYQFDNTNIFRLSIGPSATYYFTTLENAAFYGAAGAFYQLTNSDVTDSNGDFSTNLAVGMDYFFTPSVALGPALNWNHTYDSPANNDINVTVEFSIFL